MKKRIWIAAGFLSLISFGTARAQVPSTMAVQGVSTPTGTITGVAAVLLNGATIYEAAFSTTTDLNGVFNVLLPNLSSMTFYQNGSYTMQFYVAGTTTTLPISVVPFAYRASVADNATGGAGNAILLQNTLQMGATFYVSSGTANNFTVGNSITLPADSIADAALSSDVTLQGNAFNGASELVQLDGSGNLPALNGAALRNLNAAALTGSLPGAVLPSTVAFTNEDNSFSATETFGSSVTVNGNLGTTGQIIAGSGNTVITTAAGLLDATKLTGSLPALNGSALTSLSYSALTGYPSGCSAGQYVSTIGSSLTCGTPNGITTAGNLATGIVNSAVLPSTIAYTSIANTFTSSQTFNSTIGASIVTTSPGTALALNTGANTGSSNSGSTYLVTGSVAHGTSGNVIVVSGNGNSIGGSSGNVGIDVGTESNGTLGTVGIATHTATAVNIGNSGTAVNFLGSQTGLNGSGASLTNLTAGNIASGGTFLAENGSALTNLNAGAIAGTLSAGLLPSTVAYTSVPNIFTSSTIFSNTGASTAGVTISSGLVVNSGGVGIGTASPASGLSVMDGNIGISASPSVMPLSTAAYAMMISLLPNGNVFEAGGTTLVSGNNLISISSASIYNPQTGLWTAAANAPGPFFKQAYNSWALSGSEVVSFGGDAPTCSAISSVTYYNYNTNVWGSTTSLPNTLIGMFAVTLSTGNILFGGGTDSYYNGTTCSNGGTFGNAYLYNPNTNGYVATGTMNAVRSFPGVALLPNGNVLAAGGATFASNNSISTVLASAEIFNTATGVWTSTGSMLTSKWFFPMFTLPNGNVIAVGGMNSSGYGAPTNDVEIFFSTAGNWGEAASLPNNGSGLPPAYFGAAQFPTGDILIFSGSDNGYFSNQTLVYQWRTNTWVTGGNYPVGGFMLGGATLANGKVLGVGGYNEAPQVYSTATIYDENFNIWKTTASTYGVSLSSTAFLDSAGGTSLSISSSPLNAPLLSVLANDHVTADGPAPSVSSGSTDCGTSPAIAGNDVSGLVTVGSSTNGGKCSITFASHWAKAPNCVVSEQTTTTALKAFSITVSSFAIAGSLTAGDKLSYLCIGN